MQEMNHEEIEGQWHHAYRGYTGDGEAQEQHFSASPLEEEHNKEWAYLQERKIAHEVQPEKDLWHNPRLLLGLVSLCILVCLFGLLTLALLLGVKDGNVGVLSFAFLLVCVAIITINISFNRTSKAMLRHLVLSLPGSQKIEPGLSAVECTPTLPIAGKPVTITYQGRLAVMASSITIHWGYSNFRDGFMMHWGQTYWNSVTDTPMNKQHNGTWQAVIKVPRGATTLNMAFHDQSRAWDNNNTSNYHFTVWNVSDM